MFTMVKDEVRLVEFLDIDNDNEFMEYVSWVRDINNIRMIGRVEYLLGMNVRNIYDYVYNLNNSENDSFFKVYINDTFAGTFKIGHIDWRTGDGEVGIMIGNPKFRGKGWSEKIVELGIDYAFNILKLRRLTGRCYAKNVAMCKCFERCGFVKEGLVRKSLIVDDEFDDRALYGLLKDDL